MKVKEIVRKFEGKRENLLQILHEIQENDPQNYISKNNIDSLSEEMKIPISDITGTASFYSMFSFKPRGKYIIRVCASPPCHIMGAETIFDAISRELKIGKGPRRNKLSWHLCSCSCSDDQ